MTTTYPASLIRLRDGDTLIASVQVAAVLTLVPRPGSTLAPAVVDMVTQRVTVPPVVVPGLPATVYATARIDVPWVVRLARCNAPEMSTPDGPKARAWADGWLLAAHADEDGALLITPHGKDRYDRLVCEVVRVSDGANLSDALIAAGEAVPYKPKLAVAFEGEVRV